MACISLIIDFRARESIVDYPVIRNHVAKLLMTLSLTFNLPFFPRSLDKMADIYLKIDLQGVPLSFRALGPIFKKPI